MELTKELVERIGALTRLTLSEEEKLRMCARLEEVLGGVTSLETLQLAEDLPDELERGGEEQ